MLDSFCYKKSWFSYNSFETEMFAETEHWSIDFTLE